MEMKKAILILSFILFCVSSYSQSIVRASEIDKISNDGIELMYVNGKVFNGFVVDSYLNGQHCSSGNNGYENKLGKILHDFPSKIINRHKQRFPAELPANV